MKLSVIMSIYHKEKVNFFHRAMQSVWDEQTLKPNEIILVQDGPLTEALYRNIDEWKTKLGSTLIIVSLKKNIGTGGAKRIAIENTSYDFIAVMDTDDISMPHRFEKQLNYLENHKDIDAIGTFISEIDEKEEIIRSIVKYPLSHKELFQLFKKRDIIAHPTTMFKRSYFTKAGNYQSHLFLAEDTLLWYSGFLKGCKFANIDYIGLKFRRTTDFYKRRSNFKKSIGLLKYRLLKINRDLNYGRIADVYAILYFLLSQSPSFIKKNIYKSNFFR